MSKGRTAISEVRAIKAEPRVCPKCWHMWLREDAFMLETEGRHIETRYVVVHVLTHEATHAVPAGRYAYTIAAHVREHTGCGGQMYDRGRVVATGHQYATPRTGGLVTTAKPVVAD